MTELSGEPRIRIELPEEFTVSVLPDTDPRDGTDLSAYHVTVQRRHDFSPCWVIRHLPTDRYLNRRQEWVVIDENDTSEFRHEYYVPDLTYARTLARKASWDIQVGESKARQVRTHLRQHAMANGLPVPELLRTNQPHAQVRQVHTYTCTILPDRHPIFGRSMGWYSIIIKRQHSGDRWVIEHRPSLQVLDQHGKWVGVPSDQRDKPSFRGRFGHDLDQAFALAKACHPTLRPEGGKTVGELLDDMRALVKEISPDQSR